MPFRVYQNVLAVHLRRQYVLVNITVQLPLSYEMQYPFARHNTKGNQRQILAGCTPSFTKGNKSA